MSESIKSPMDAKTYPLQEILKPERRYIIPTFQRDYEWTEDGQWRLLFEDLETTANRLLEVRGSGATGSTLQTKEQSISPHFLGAIVCAGLPFSTGGVALRSVIDGQQRLTTVQLMIRGLLDVFQEIKSDRVNSIGRMLFNPDDIIESPEERYKLWPRRKDREVWPAALDDCRAEDERSGDHPYLRAREFFSQSARDFALNSDETLDELRLRALGDALASLFKLVVIDLDDNDDAQVIFEVLNGRQTALSAIDLVKNLVFMRCDLDGEDVDTLYDEYWAQFDDDWWREEIGRGHAQRGRRDVLLSAWLTAARGSEANVGHLYREAREHLDDKLSVEAVLQELDSFAKAYRVIYGAAACEDERLAVSYRRIRSLDITTAVPLLAWLRLVDPKQLPLDDHIRAVTAIESWALRRSFVGWQTRGYGTHLSRVLREAKQAREDDHDIADTIVFGLQSGHLNWPSDAEVRSAFLDRRIYGGMSQARIRLLLSAIDQRLRADDPNEPSARIDYKSLQIEHVLPQKWSQHWPLRAKDGSVVTRDADELQWQSLSSERDRAVNRIGNLTLVSPSFNGSVSNSSWEFKKAEFQNQKSLAINYGIAHTESWDEARIEHRAKHLAEITVAIWPPPTDLVSVPASTSEDESS